MVAKRHKTLKNLHFSYYSWIKHLKICIFRIIAWIKHLKICNLGVKKVEAPSKCPEKWLKKFLSQKKNYVPHFLKQRDINSYWCIL
jgi:hypothetical protein